MYVTAPAERSGLIPKPKQRKEKEERLQILCIYLHMNQCFMPLLVTTHHLKLEQDGGFCLFLKMMMRYYQLVTSHELSMYLLIYNKVVFRLNEQLQTYTCRIKMPNSDGNHAYLSLSLTSLFKNTISQWPRHLPQHMAIITFLYWSTRCLNIAGSTFFFLNQLSSVYISENSLHIFNKILTR